MERTETFQLVSSYTPKGSQPKAIEVLSKNLKAGVKDQVLLGITGSGKTFTMANVIATVNKPTLVMAHNKTLAAQLYMELRELFPKNAVEYFVSFYDYYQPEAYVPSSDTYIEKDSAINETIDKMRHAATRSLLERNDVIIVSSVSCIYGLGSPEAYYGMLLHVQADQEMPRKDIISKLVLIGYQRNDFDFSRGTFRVRGDTIDVFPASEESRGFRIELFGDHVESLSEIDALTGQNIRKLSKISVYPTSHYVTPPETIKKAIATIQMELDRHIVDMKNSGKVLEAKRIEQRTKFDLEMLEQAGFCLGIENYSRHLTGRAPGEPPYTLFDYFPKDFLLVLDESHATVPQIGGMYKGDRSRKMTLVDHGFRLPSALDNRPLQFSEFLTRINQTIYVSATPANYELDLAKGHLVEQIIRPTGLLDPQIEVKPAKNQVDYLIKELHPQIAKKERTLVTTLTKKSAENLTEYLQSLGFKVRYMHADVETLERSQLLKELRLGVYDILVGINLLREGLDLPEVSLVAILDADKEGFLRSTRSLLQTCGRAARNANGRVIMFADEVTESMEAAIKETERRRQIQIAYNEKHGITPGTISTPILKSLQEVAKEAGFIEMPVAIAEDLESLGNDLQKLEAEKKQAVKELDFEKAAKIRDRILALKRLAVVDPTGA
ncbi:MAG: excinuclease ABC subunit UvrB [Deltaproteobacteria bacterium]|nr:excinuclease ABC subunit UvrB [Deltaproteobacteria bacterium]